MYLKKLIIVAIYSLCLRKYGQNYYLIIVEKPRVVPVVDIGAGGDEVAARQCLVKRRIIPPMYTYLIGQ
jgi:hypothetical protein